MSSTQKGEEDIQMKMESFVALSVLGLLCCFVFACASDSAGTSVRGTALYRERIALPPGAVLEVSLQDVSRQDVAAETLGSVTIEDPGSPPFAFEIPYDEDAIDERHTYAVRATIKADGKLLFTTDTTYPVLTRDAGNEVELMLRHVARDTHSSSPSLEDTYWKLTFIGDEPAPVLEGKREPHIVLDSEQGMVGGTGGCNRITGSYEIDAGSISFGNMAVTKKACFDDQDVDSELAAALEKAVGARGHKGLLELLDADGTVVAKFVAKE
jgi:putative lipoprotein